MQMFKYILAMVFCSFNISLLSAANVVKAESNLPNTVEPSIDFPTNNLPSAGNAAEDFFTEALIKPTNTLDETSIDELFKKAPLKIDRSVEKMNQYKNNAQELKLPTEKIPVSK
jgi:hypothetical protein